MNIFSDVFKNSILKNGIYRREDISNLALKLVHLASGQLVDGVSGHGLEGNFGGVRYDLVNGVQTAFSATQPVVTEKGIRCVGAYSNMLLQSNSFLVNPWDGIGYSSLGSVQGPLYNTTATKLLFENAGIWQTLPFSVGVAYSAGVWIKANKTTTIFLRNPGAPIGSPVPVNIDTFWNFFSLTATAIISSANFIIDGREAVGSTPGLQISIFGAQVSKKKYPHPYVPTTTSAVLSTADSGSATAGVADYGAWFDNVPLQFPRFKQALETKGTLTFPWTPGYNKADVSGDLNVWSFNCMDNSIFYDATNGLIKITDGTNVATCPLIAVADTTYNIKLTWESGLGARVWVGSTAGDLITSWNGFQTGNDFILGLDNPELHYVGLPATCYVKPDWSSPL